MNSYAWHIWRLWSSNCPVVPHENKNIRHLIVTAQHYKTQGELCLNNTSSMLRPRLWYFPSNLMVVSLHEHQRFTDHDWNIQGGYSLEAILTSVSTYGFCNFVQDGQNAKMTVLTIQSQYQIIMIISNKSWSQIMTLFTLLCINCHYKYFFLSSLISHIYVWY